MNVLAKAHVNLGFLAALALKIPLPVGPVAILALAINLTPGFMKFIIFALMVALSVFWPSKAEPLLTTLVVMMGSLAADLDEPNSILSRIIAPTTSVIRILLIAAGAVIVYVSWGNILVIIPGLFLLVSGLLNISIFPMEKLQRIILVASGIYLITWSFNQYVLSLGALYLLMGILSHRGLTHSPEGLILASIGAWWYTQNAGHQELLWPFVIGYATHLLADALSDHGIYITYIGGVKASLPLVRTAELSGRLAVYISLAVLIFLSVGGMEESSFFNIISKFIAR